MKIEKAGDLVFLTYFMVDWKKIRQAPSDQKCTECGKPMMKSEPAVDSKGQKYDGYVCHSDKRLVWIKAP